MTSSDPDKSPILEEKESLFFNITGNWYKGKLPSFYDASQLKSTAIIENNYSQIKEEILKFYTHDQDKFEPMYVPHKYVDVDWVVYNFYGFMLKYPEKLKNFPVLDKVLRQIPDMVSAQISVLKPHTRIKAHISGSNSLIRSHLGILIPGEYPDLGIRINTEERCWEEGKVIAFTESHRHYAWNNTDFTRIVLLIDTIHPQYSNKKYYICASSLSILILKMITTKFPLTKKCPKTLVFIFHKIFMMPFYIIFFLQDKFNIYIASFLQKFKFKIKS